jgi:hypothetical protein
VTFPHAGAVKRISTRQASETQRPCVGIRKVATTSTYTTSTRAVLDDLDCASASASTGQAALGQQIGAPLASEAPEGASLNTYSSA